MNELFQACYAQLLKGGGYFIFGYLLVAFAMWKWQAPVGRKLSVASGGRLAMRFEPWKSRADSSNISLNNAAFEQWYNDLINATHRRIPRPLKACPKALLRRLSTPLSGLVVLTPRSYTLSLSHTIRYQI
nr:hypothetical protein Q903MT_gene4526 [Picea sitchensis]